MQLVNVHMLYELRKLHEQLLKHKGELIDTIERRVVFYYKQKIKIVSLELVDESRMALTDNPYFVGNWNFSSGSLHIGSAKAEFVRGVKVFDGYNILVDENGGRYFLNDQIKEDGVPT